MANRNISIAEALQKVSKTAQEYINKNTPHIISEDVILTIPASSIVKADYENATSNNEPYYVKITDTVAEEFNENNLYSVKYNGKKYECIYNHGSYFVSTDTMVIGIRINNDDAPVSLDNDVSAQSVTAAPTPPYCYIGLIDTTNITDIQLISKKVQRLDNMYLKRDLEVVNSLTLGNRTGDIGEYSSASGNDVEASGSYSHAEGRDTIASDGATHAEGDGTKATNWGAHAEGCNSTSSGYYSHVEGYYTKASSDHQHVQGQYNIEDTEGKYAHIVGNGAKDQTTNWKEVRSNAHTLDWKGNAWFAGDVQANNVPHVISEDVVLTIPASSIVKADYEDATANDRPYFVSITGAVPTINSDGLYVIKYNNVEYDATAHYGSGLVVKDPNCDILIVLKDPQSVNETGDSGIEDRVISVPPAPYCAINKLNVDNITDIEVKSIKIQKLNNKFLESDLKIKNSISIGRTGSIGELSTAVGGKVEASGKYSHAEGSETKASAESSHAEGWYTAALAINSHAEGSDTTASGDSSHAEGNDTTASGEASHAEGWWTTASAQGSHAEGDNTIASGKYQHVQGRFNIEDTEGKYAHIVGNGTNDKSTNWKDVRSNAHTLDWKGNAWYAGDVQANNVPHIVSENAVLTIPAATITAKKTEIDNLTNDSDPVTIPVDGTVTYDPTKLYYLKYNNKQYSASTNEGRFMIVGDDCLCGIDTTDGDTTLLIGKLDTTNITDMQLIEKDVKKLDNIYVPNDLRVSNSITVGGARQGEIGLFSSTFGSLCEASGIYSHAEGDTTTASGECSHAEGSENTASGSSSHAEGDNTTASGSCSHAEGSGTNASGDCSHAEGGGTVASGSGSHAEGNNNAASGNSSHSEGRYNTASGDYSHAEGYTTKASSDCQHVQGKFNIEDTANKYAHIVGNGSGADNRANAHTLDWNGNGWYAGKLSQEGTPTEDKDLATKKYVDDNSTNVADGFIMNDQVNGNKYLIQMKDGVLTSILLPTSISVDTSSLQGVTFMEGDAIDVETLTFMANYPDGTSSQITDTENLSYSPSELTTDVTQISFVYNITGLKLTYDMPVTVTAFDPAVKLQDFTYTTNNDGTYTLTGWKETHNGVASTELIIPNNKKIIL